MKRFLAVLVVLVGLAAAVLLGWSVKSDRDAYARETAELAAFEQRLTEAEGTVAEYARLRQVVWATWAESSEVVE